MAEPPTPIVFSWEKPCNRAFVTGDFNDFTLTELKGTSVKSVVVWLTPGPYYFRFVVDGRFEPFDQSTSELVYGGMHNKLTVYELPAEIRDIKHLTMQELETIDNMLFTSQSSNEVSDDESMPSSPRSIPVRQVSCKYDLQSIKAFEPVKRAVVKLQAMVRMVLCRLRYVRFLESRSRGPTVGRSEAVVLEHDSLFARVIEANLMSRRKQDGRQDMTVRIFPNNC